MAPPRKRAPVKSTRPVRSKPPSDNYASFKAKALVSRGAVAGAFAGGAWYWYSKVLPGMLAAGSFKKLHLNLILVDFSNKQLFGIVAGGLTLMSIYWIVKGIITYFEERSARGRPSASTWT